MTRRFVLVTGAAVVLCAWCGWVSGFHRSTAAAGITWGISLAAVVAVDVSLWRGRRGGRWGLRVESMAARWPAAGTRGRAVLGGLTPWVILVLVMAGWEALGIDTGRHVAHLTISALTQAYRPLNAAMLLVWMGVGVGYGVMRARSPVRSSPGPVRPGAGSPAAWSALPVVVGSGFAGSARPLVPGLLLPDDRAAGVAFWVGVVVVAAVVDVVARRSHGHLASAEQFLRLVTAPKAANALWVLAWTFAGYHLYAH